MTEAKINMDKHPVFVLPSPEETRIMGKEEWGRFMVRRSEAIKLEQDDPLNYGWEPLIWKVVDALFGFDCLDPRFEKEIRARFGEDKDWDWWAEKIRQACGFPAPVKMILINGGNRGGKSQYGGKRSVQVLYSGPKKEVWGFHNTRPMSQQYMMPVINDHLPVGKKFAQIQDGRPEYISYKSATGFSNDKFVNELGGTMMFKWYSSDIKDIEGGEIDFGWGDEHIDSERVHTLRLRVATRDGRILVTFTPTMGYTETVRMFQDGADVMRSLPGFLLPDDEGAALPWLALGFRSEEEWRRAQILGPASKPEDIHSWIEGKDHGMPEVPEGRKFKMVPRVLRCAGQMEGRKLRYNAAVVFFHTTDNPYGNPEVVYRNCLGKDAGFIKERFYGLAEKSVSACFPKFNEKVHVLDPADIPEKGTNYCLCDPSSGRNFVFLWMRVVKNSVYVYREWPGNYPIPGVGLPGPWAEVDGKRMDGKKGPAQSPFGFDLRAYKREIVRLEGWDVDRDRDILTARPGPRTRERLALRFIDARGSGGSSVGVSGTDSLLQDMNAKLNMEWHPVTLQRDGQRQEINVSLSLVNDLLYYDESREIDFTNRPRLFISRECQNLIFAMKVWTGQDGNKGACKDFPDLLRYGVAQGLVDCGDKGMLSVSGGGVH